MKISILPKKSQVGLHLLWKDGKKVKKERKKEEWSWSVCAGPDCRRWATGVLIGWVTAGVAWAEKAGTLLTLEGDRQKIPLKMGLLIITGGLFIKKIPCIKYIHSHDVFMSLNMSSNFFIVAGQFLSSPCFTKYSSFYTKIFFLSQFCDFFYLFILSGNG